MATRKAATASKFMFFSYLFTYVFAAFIMIAVLFSLLAYIASAALYIIIILFGQYPPAWLLWSLLVFWAATALFALAVRIGFHETATKKTNQKAVRFRAAGFLINFALVVFLIFFSGGIGFGYVRLIAVAALLLTLLSSAGKRRGKTKKPKPNAQ